MAWGEKVPSVLALVLIFSQGIFSRIASVFVRPTGTASVAPATKAQDPAPATIAADAEKAIREKIAAEYEAKMAREREAAAKKEKELKAAAEKAQREKEQAERAKEAAEKEKEKEKKAKEAAEKEKEKEKKAKEAAEKQAADAKAALAVSAASSNSASGASAWSAMFKGDFELPVPKSQLTKTGDQASISLVQYLTSYSFAGIQRGVVD